MNIISRTLLLAHVSAAAIALPAPLLAAPADDAAPAEASADAPTPGDGDIVVTARRRAENAQDVPLAISIVDSRSLESTGSFNVGKLTQLQPSIQFYSSNPRNSAPNIRGLGAPFGLTNDGIEQGVGIYVDQVYYARSASTTFDFLDVDQIEILRGPQGTLYGKNTTAGAINITSRAPSFTPEGRAEFTVGNLGFVQAKGSISGPLIEDRLAIRLATSATHRRGTIYNVTTGNYINEQENLGFKGQLLLRATDSLSLTLAADYNRQNPECCGQIYVRTGATQRPLNRQFAELARLSGNYAVPSTNPFDRITDLDGELQAKQELGGVSLRAEWNLGGGTLTSVSAWRFWNWTPSNDRDFIGLPITTISANPSKQRQLSQELRYASAGGGSIDYVAGLFAFRQTIHTSGVQEQGPLASRWLLSGANANDPTILDGLRSENDIDFTNTSLAAFGQLTWRATDRLRLQPGIRINYDKKNGSYVATVTNATNTALTAAQLSVLAPQNYNPKFSDWNVSGDFTLSYDLTDDVLAYATYAKSFKSGGINLSGLPLDAANNPITAVQTIKPEKVDHFEVGLKTQLFDRRVTFNLAGFWTSIENYQATVTNGQANVIRGYLANAQQVRVRGIEADISARLSNQLRLYLNTAYTDHEYVKFADAPCPPELAGGTAAGSNPPGAPGTPGGPSPANCDISGQWLPGISKWALSYGGEYHVPATILGLDGEVYLGVDASTRSKFSSNPSRSLYTDVGGYTLTNFRAGFRADQKWEIYGWVRNAFDTEYFDFLSTQSGNTGLVIGQPGDPRTFGITGSARF